MYIKFFTAVSQPVPDPLRPNRRVNTTRLQPTPSPLRRGDVVYEPAEDGWVEVPEELGREMCSYRNRESGWYAEGSVADAVRFGALDAPDRPRPAAKPEPRPRSRRGDDA